MNMKIRLFLMIIALPLLFSSCSVVTYTHQEVMDEVIIGSTKEDVLVYLGVPDEKIIEGNYERWDYYGDTKTTSYTSPTRSNSSINVSPTGARANIHTNTYSGRTISRTSTAYMKITFLNGKGISWDTNGVDFSQTEPNKNMTVFAIMTSLIVVGMIFILAGPTGV